MADDIQHDLYAIFARCWDLLERSARHPETRMHAPVLASVGSDGLPDARTVVIETAEAATRRLFINTDWRSPKRAELQANPQVMLVFYEGDTQVRARAETLLHHGDTLARRSWERLPEQQRAHYRTRQPPGAIISRQEALTYTPAPPDPEAGWQNYAVIEAHITALDWLHMEAAGQRRAAFSWSDEGYIAGHWLAP